MFSQTLGTALGDFLADTGGLGYNGAALAIVIIVCILLIPQGAGRHPGANETAG